MNEGYRITYNPCAHAQTHAPESVKDFYHQRLRWTSSIIPNTLDILRANKTFKGGSSATKGLCSVANRIVTKFKHTLFYLYVVSHFAF